MESKRRWKCRRSHRGSSQGARELEPPLREVQPPPSTTLLPPSPSSPRPPNRAHTRQVGDVQRYLDQGPGFIFLFHPALGPLWDVIAQKIRGGAVMDGSELVSLFWGQGVGGGSGWGHWPLGFGCGLENNLD